MRYKSLPSSVRSGAPDHTDPHTPPSRPRPQPRPHRLRDILATIPVILLLPALLLPYLSAQASVGGSLIASPAELAVLPTSGSAWTALKAVADGSLGVPDLTDQNNKHDVRTLAVALVANRLDSATYRAKAQAAIMSAVGTERVGADNSILSLGRQLGAYVMAADLIGLSGPDGTTFRSWLSAIRTRDLGGHSRYYTLKRTCEDSPHNWGTFACASLISANIYLGDDAAVARSWAVFRGMTGERTAYAGFQDLSSDAWACPGKAFTPFNSGCPDDAIRYGAFVKDVTRGDDPPTATGAGLSYTAEILQGIALQAELLSRVGHTDAWGRLRPAFDWARRTGAMNLSSVDYHVTWWVNERYGWGMPTKPAGFGRVFGYTDWLYGAPAAGTVPPPTPKPTAAPTASPAPTPTSTAVTTATPTPVATPSATPVTTATATPSPSPTAGIATVPAPTPTPSVAPIATASPTPAPTVAPGSGFSSVKQAGAAIVDVTTGANLTAIDLSIDRPAQLASGDLLVAAVSVRGKPAIDPPSGWQRVHLDNNGTIVELATYVHVATGDEPAAYTWRFSNAQAAAGTIVAVRGAAADPVGDVAGQVNAKSASIAGPASRSDRAGSLVLGFFAPARVASVAAPAGMTRLGQASSTAGTYRTTIQVSAASTGDGPVDGPVATADGAAASAAQVLIVRP